MQRSQLRTSCSYHPPSRIAILRFAGTSFFHSLLWPPWQNKTQRLPSVLEPGTGWEIIIKNSGCIRLTEKPKLLDSRLFFLILTFSRTKPPTTFIMLAYNRFSSFGLPITINWFDNRLKSADSQSTETVALSVSVVNGWPTCSQFYNIHSVILVAIEKYRRQFF